MSPPRSTGSEIVLVHSSDLHIGDPLPGGDDRLRGLERVLATASAQRADIVLLAGDTFDHARIAAPVLRRTRELLGAAGRAVVLLPGNHDSIQDTCLFRRAGLADLPDVHVLGVTCEAFVRGDIGLEVHGLPHRGFADFPPFGAPRARALRWQVVMAHGHYVPPGEEAVHAHRAWRFDDEAVAGSGADYVALGHWDRPARVGSGDVPAFYSGSPDLAQTVNVVRLHDRRGVAVTREPLIGAK